MCGLISMFSEKHFSPPELKALKELFVLTTLRGIDSTGMVAADTIDKNTYTNYKSVGNFYDFIGGAPESMSKLRANLAMGHCRYSTVGESSVDNAHPYEFDKIIGMHNGTLEDVEYDPRASINKAFEDKTDSFLFLQKLNQVIKGGGCVDDLVKDLSWYSAYAMVIWDYRDKVSVFRNYARPLSIGVSKENGTVVLASEERALRFIENSSISFDIHEVKEDTLYEIDLSLIGSSKTPWIESSLTSQLYSIRYDYNSWPDKYDGYHWCDNTKQYVYTPKDRLPF